MSEDTCNKATTSKSERMTTAARRLWRDFKRLVEDPPDGISAAPVGDNILLWNALICGTNETPVEDGTFKLTIQFNEEYPKEPPVVKFLSKMFHPNIVEEDGQVGLDIYWLPAFGISTILVSIQSLLRDPNLIGLPANKLAGQLLRENKREYLKRVKLL